MKILVTGSTGFIGSALVPFLIREGHSVTCLVRPQTRLANGHVRWDPEAGEIDAGRLAGTEAAVHLAGESLASGRWTAQRKRRMLDSRVRGTRLLTETLARLDPSPGVLVAASAVGYYGDRGEEVLQEESGPGSAFLADLVRQWEAATEAASQAGIRVVNLRSGLVLGPRGPLARMALPFRLGLGGKLGSGAQLWSWVSLEDAVRAIHHALTTEALQGPVNMAAPGVVTNAQFTQILGRVLSRPTLFPVPAFVLRLVFGEMADEALLASARMDSARLLDSGFEFHHPQLEGALRAMLGR